MGPFLLSKGKGLRQSEGRGGSVQMHIWGRPPQRHPLRISAGPLWGEGTSHETRRTPTEAETPKMG